MATTTTMYGGASQDDVAQQRKLAQQLMTSGMSAEPVQHWTQGLARVLQAGVGGMHQAQARQSEKDMSAHLAQSMQNGKYDIPTLLSNPLGRPFAFQLAQQQAEQNTPYAKARLAALEQETKQGAELHPLRMSQMRTQTGAAAAAEQRASELHPFEIQMRQKQIEAAKVGKAKEDEYLYVPDPTQPGGVRIIQPAAGAGGNKKFADESAKAQVERYTKHVEAGDLVERSAVDMATLRQLSGRVGDPSIQNTLTRTLGPYARTLGIDITNMSQIEAFTAVVSRLAPNMRPPGSGATSDFEFKQYLASLPQLAQTSEGRKLIMDQFEVFAQHALAKREIAARVLNGDIDRREGDRMLQQLPDPLALWKQKTGAGDARRGQAPQGGQGAQQEAAPAQAAPLAEGGTYRWTPQGLQRIDGPQTQAPEQPPIDTSTPAGRAQAARQRRQQAEAARQAEIEAARQQQRDRSAMGQTMFNRQFEADLSNMHPMAFVEKYDAARGQLSADQIRILNSRIDRLTRGGQ